MRSGDRRPHTLLRREGWAVDAGRVARPDRLEVLGLRRGTGRRRVAARGRPVRPAVTGANPAWAVEVVGVTRNGGRRVRTVVDRHTRASVAVRAGHRFPAERVAAGRDEVVRERGKPAAVRVDNGPVAPAARWISGRMVSGWP